MEVLVVGAGPTGLTAALELKSQGVDCRLIDTAQRRSEHTRAIVVHARTLELLQRHRLASTLLSLGTTALGVSVRTKRGERARVKLEDLGVKDSPYPYVLFISQADTEKTLEAKLSQLGAQVEWGVTLEAVEQGAEGVVSTVRHANGRKEVIRSRFVVGADGAHSAVRKSLDLVLEGETYPQTFLLADAELSGETQPGMLTVFLGTEGLLIIFPYKQPGRYRVMATRSSSNEAEPTLQEFQALLNAATTTPPKIESASWLAQFRLHHRGVKRYSKGRIFLAGDAAHLHSPAGGQGMNTGIQDAVNLSWKLAMVLRGEATEGILESYHAERFPIGQQLLAVTDRMFSFLSGSNRTLVRLRNAIAPRLLPPLLARESMRARAFRFASQLAIRYRRSPLVEQRDQRLPRAGDRAPDAPMPRDGNLLERLDGFHHTLLVFQNAGEKPGTFSGLPGWITPLIVTESAEPLRDRYDAHDPTLILIRPDGHIAYRQTGLNTDALQTFLNARYVCGVRLYPLTLGGARRVRKNPFRSV
ncbi:MAG: FAD-dependent monooxygenase [Myxococcaceae bacterium]